MPKVKQELKERNAPRLSVNSLSEYLVASAARRRRILEEQKRPRDFQVSYYKEVAEAIVDCIADGMNLKKLDEVKSAASRTSPDNEWEAGRRAAGLEAAESFRKLARELEFDGYKFFRGGKKPRRFDLAGVSVSVRPEILLKAEKDSGIEAGGLKLFFSKSKPLKGDRARYIGTILYKYLRSRAKDRSAVKYRHCYVVDVFAGQVFTAPRTYKRRSKDVEAGCEEIARLWSFV